MADAESSDGTAEQAQLLSFSVNISLVQAC